MKLERIEAYLLELISEKLVKKQRGGTYKSPIYNSVKSKQVTLRDSDSYYISEAGIEYVENSFVKPERQSEISKLVEVNIKANELLTLMLQASSLSLAEQQKQSELMSMLTDALDSNDDSKARNVLIKGLGIGKEVAVPWLVEFLKGYFKLGV